MSRTGVVLAAGRGSRLAPVTDHTPKPLVPFFGVPLIHAAVRQLERAGVERVAVNAHHLAQALVAFVEGPLSERFPKIDFHVSKEPTLLGTGGALALLADWLREDATGFWVCNSDAVHTADLTAMAEAHALRDSDATLMVTFSADPDVTRNVDISAGHRFEGLTAAPADSAATYCGVLRAQLDLLDALPMPVRECCVIRQGLIPWKSQGANVDTWTFDGFWADLGTPERYLRAHLAGMGALERLQTLGLFPPP